MIAVRRSWSVTPIVSYVGGLEDQNVGVDKIWLRADGTDVEITVWVVPGASRTEVKGLYGDALRIRVAAPPEGGKANKAIVRLLGDLVGAEVELIRGHSSRRKTFRVRGVEVSAVAAALGHTS